MTPKWSATKTFGWDSQSAFASASGDINPIHVDPIAARRTQAGFPVVHGIHGLMWALEELVSAGAVDRSLIRINVRFIHFVHVGDSVRMEARRTENGDLRAELLVDGLVVTRIALTLGARTADQTEPLSDAPARDQSAPIDWSLDALSTLSGVLDPPDRLAIAAIFPALDAALGGPRAAALAALSTLVGMVCPGLHSVFSGLDVTLSAQARAPVTFAVTNVSQAARLVEMSISGGGLQGLVKAFHRHPPVEPAIMAALRPWVEPDAFKDVDALIVGGSRGLGATAAMLLAAGGARTTLTYVVGHDEAEALADQINSYCGRPACQARRLDVRTDIAPQLADLRDDINQLYYFATPTIARRKTRTFCPTLFAEFCAFYVSGFEAICRALRTRIAHPLQVFYPSSVFVDDRPQGLTEYAMAKAAGEVLCADLRRAGWAISVERLPRLLTDQTASTPGLEADSTLDALLSVVRGMQTHAGARADPDA